MARCGPPEDTLSGAPPARVGAVYPLPGEVDQLPPYLPPPGHSPGRRLAKEVQRGANHAQLPTRPHVGEEAHPVVNVNSSQGRPETVLFGDAEIVKYVRCLATLIAVGGLVVDMHMLPLHTVDNARVDAVDAVGSVEHLRPLA